MSKVLIIGAGGVGTVVAHKVAQHPEVFTEVMIASRTQSKCDAIVKAIGNPNIKTAKVDADNVDELVTLFNSFKPEIVINVALPYQDLTIMEACLKAGVNYLDTANYEPKDEAHFEYSWQWAYKKRFEEAGLTAILGCGFDPGVSGVYTAYAAKHHFDEIQYLDIVDCNAGNHHKAFATNFNPEINIREITQNGRYYENGLGGLRDAEKAIDYYTLAANQEYLWAYDALASCYLSRRDFANAAEWLQKAYDKDFLIVCHNLGDLYYYGNGVKQSYKKAFEIFSRGVEKNPRCAYRMAIMYRDGLGVKKNLNLYTAFILQAAEKGIDRAQYLWACDKYAGSNTHRDYKEAVNYFQLALKSKFLSADIRKDICLKLSDCYRYGKGVGKDLAKADYYESEAGRL